MAVEFGLGMNDPLKTAETLQMGTTHIGDEAKIGVGNAT